MNNVRKRNRDMDDAQEDEEEEVVNDGVNDAFRKKVVRVVCAVIIIFNVFLRGEIQYCRLFFRRQWLTYQRCSRAMIMMTKFSCLQIFFNKICGRELLQSTNSARTPLANQSSHSGTCIGAVKRTGIKSIACHKRLSIWSCETVFRFSILTQHIPWSQQDFDLWEE